MRLLRDTLVALMLVGLLAGIVWHNRADHVERAMLDTVREEVRRFQRQILFQATLGEVGASERGYPLTIDPAWFGNQLPTNALLGSTHPWLEIAGPDQSDLHHPPQLVADREGLAKFWYNPTTGSVRARVAAGASDRATLAIYNHINDSHVPGLFARDEQEADNP